MGYFYNKTHTITFFKKIRESDQIEEMLMYKDLYPNDYKKYVNNSWEDLDLIPINPPIFSPPPLKEVLIDVPGSNGIIDLSDFSTGSPLYSNRTGSFEFYVINKSGNKNYWSEIYSKILYFLNKKEVYAILDDDKYYYYKGKFYINDFKSDKIASKIVINYNVYPYKYEIISTSYFAKSSSEMNEVGATWLWDPFDFKNGVIQGVSQYYLFNQTNNNKIVNKIFSLKTYTSFYPDQESYISIILDGYQNKLAFNLQNPSEGTSMSDWNIAVFLIVDENKNPIQNFAYVLGSQLEVRNGTFFYEIPKKAIGKGNQLRLYLLNKKYNKGEISEKPYIEVSIEYRGEAL